MVKRKAAIGRAGEKLAHALDVFGIDPIGQVCADLGCNVGGFVACLLQRRAAKVYAVDTGYGVLDWTLRNRADVVVMERTNALHVMLPAPVDLVTVDVGWTPQRLIVPAALKLLKPIGTVISLLKPHYEAAPEELQRGAVKPECLDAIVGRTVEELRVAGHVIRQIERSPLVGGKGGNAEFLLWIEPGRANAGK